MATGTRRNTLQGLGIGAGIGLLAATAMVVGGAAVGTVSCALIRSPRWTRIRPQGLGVSISF